MRRAYLVSTFDMVNVADLDLLKQVRELGDEMTVGVLADELVARLHGRPAVVPEQERLDLVVSLRTTDDVQLVTSPEQLQMEGVTVYTDEETLAQHVDAVLVPTRRSASPELLAALAHGSSTGPSSTDGQEARA